MAAINALTTVSLMGYSIVIPQWVNYLLVFAFLFVSPVFFRFFSSLFKKFES